MAATILHKILAAVGIAGFAMATLPEPVHAGCTAAAASCNPCAAACGACNPCAAACNPCELLLCNPCAAAACNPCAAAACNPCAAACNACAAN